MHEGNRIYPENNLDEIDLTYFCGTAKLHVWKAKSTGQTLLTLRNGDNQIVDRRFIEGGMNDNDCGDFLNIGEPIFYISGWTGGMHCCADRVYYAVGRKPRLLLAYYQGDFNEVEEPFYQDIDGDGIPEIILTEDNFSDLGGMCCACESFMKIVFCYQNGYFKECTLSHEAWLEKEKNDALNWIRNIYHHEPQEPPYLGPTGKASVYFGYSVLEGRETEAMEILRISLPKDAYQDLRRVLPEIRKALKGRARLLHHTQQRMHEQYRR